MNQKELNKKNAEFWDELCGTTFAKFLGINEINPENLQRFDDEYLKFYPYLNNYIELFNLKERRILEIGLGYGTLGQILATKGNYYGIDISEGPVRMMKYRLNNREIENPDNIQIGSVLNLPFKEQSFDFVYSIGCLHHTGNIELAIDQIWRVLKKDGYAIIMLYNRNSFRQLFDIPLAKIENAIRGRVTQEAYVNSLYDQNSSGKVAPFIEYVTIKDVRGFCHKFSEIHIDKRNFSNYELFGKFKIDRRIFLNNIARMIGLDLYIIAKK